MKEQIIQRHAETRGRTEPPTAPHSLKVLFGLGVRELVLSKKTLVVLFLGGLLTLSSVCFSACLVMGWARRANVPLFFGVMVTEAFLRFLLPVVSLFYGASLVTDEVDGRTLTYLTTRPVDKRLILWGKFFAFTLVAVVLLEVTLFLCWLALATSQGPSGIVTHLHLLMKDGLVTVLGILAYGAFFTFLGSLLRKPVIPGLVFTFVWEQFASFLPGTTQRLTILHYLQALTPHTMAPSEEFAFLSSLYLEENAIVAVLVLLAITAVFLLLAGQVFRNREYRMEK